MLRIGFVKDKISYIPEHDSLLWYFIELYMLSRDIIEDRKDRLRFVSVIAAGGPYESQYAEGAINNLLEDYDKITLMFKDKTESNKEEEISFEELDDLMSSL